jgi:Tol biopolymer transport system component/DNA-binding winged helix-turn-helix (wHTH) protein
MPEGFRELDEEIMRDMTNRIFRFGNVEIDVQNLRVTVASEIRPLEPKSFRLLLFLVENPGRALTKEEIMGEVWPDAFVSDNSLARAITQIRRVLDDDSKAPRYVETIPTVGYRFIGEITERPEAPTVAGEDVVLAPIQRSNSISESRSIKLPLGVAACLLLAAAVVWWFVAGSGSSVPYPLHVTRVSKLTSYPGDEREPAISPDGSYVAFSWSGTQNDNYDIYVVQSAGQPPLRLTTDPAPDSYPAWSPDGRQIAFIRRNREMANLIVVPSLGGPERTIHQFYRIGTDLDETQQPVLSWSQDGKGIIFSGQSRAGEKYQLFLLSVDAGAVRPISAPETTVAGDSSPAISGDGRFLAFARYLAPRNGRILVQSLGAGMVPQGQPIEVPNNRLAVHSPAWLEDGKQLLFADYTQIFQWDRKKGTIPIYAVSGVLGGMSLGPSRRDNTRQVVVAGERGYSNIWSIPLNAEGTRSTGPPQEFLRSTAGDEEPDFSPDGRRVAFVSSRGGAGEVWVADADGSNPRQVTHLGAYLLGYPKWSPDGTRVAFHARLPYVAEVYVVDVDRGAPQQITHADPGLALTSWSNNGRFLYASTLMGGISVTHRFAVQGGPVERLWEGSLACESVDGKYILYWRANTPGIFRRSSAGDLAKNPEEPLIPDFWPNNHLGGYAPVADGVYYVSGDAKGKPSPFRFFDYATHKSIDVAPPAPGLARGFAVSPDRRRILFAARSPIGGDLLSLELK